MKTYIHAFLILALVSLASAQPQSTPYDAIKNALPDTLDQLVRDSLNIKINPIRVNQAGYRPQDAAYIYYVGSATTFDQAKNIAKNIGFPLMVRAAFALGGQKSGVAHNTKELKEIVDFYNFSNTKGICQSLRTEKTYKGYYWKLN